MIDSAVVTSAATESVRRNDISTLLPHWSNSWCPPPSRIRLIEPCTPLVIFRVPAFVLLPLHYCEVVSVVVQGPNQAVTEGMELWRVKFRTSPPSCWTTVNVLVHSLLCPDRSRGKHCQARMIVAFVRLVCGDAKLGPSRHPLTFPMVYPTQPASRITQSPSRSNYSQSD